ncbi:MAG: argininosuccinate synthase [Bacteroidia bacterium]
MNEKKKIVLAFSGGLDTTYCAIYLREELNYEVHAVLVNTGGFDEDEIAAVKVHAEKLGVSSFTCIDAKEEFYEKIIRFLLFGNILKNATYPLSVSAERSLQAMCIARYAKAIEATAIAHGSTGAGNDQVRFDMVFQIITPESEIITPIRDNKISREEEIQYLKQHGVEMNFEKAAYSINKGIWGTSIGGRETLTSHLSLPELAYPSKLENKDATSIELYFESGELTRINNKQFDSRVDAIVYLNKLAGAYAIGRDIHMGDTIIGIKGRVGFEAPAALVMIKAHHALEKHVLTKWQLYWKDQLSYWYGNWLHEGQFLDPVMRNMEKFMEDTQQHVTGKVMLQLHPYRFTVSGIESAFDLMSPEFGSYGEMNAGWSGEDVKGFTKIFGNQTSIYFKVQQQQETDEKH